MSKADSKVSKNQESAPNQRRGMIREAVHDLVKIEGAMFSSFTRLAEVLEVHPSTPSGWALEDSPDPKKGPRACSVDNAWKLAALLWKPEGVDQEALLGRVRSMLQASVGWDDASWDSERARDQLVRLQEGLLSRAYPDDEFDCRRLANMAHRLAEASGFARQPDLVLRMAAKYLSQHSALRAIENILNGDKPGSLTGGDVERGGGDVRVRFFWGGSRNEVKKLMAGMAKWIGESVLGRPLVDVHTHVDGFIDCASIEAKDVVEFGSEIWKEAGKAKHGTKRHLNIYLRNPQSPGLPPSNVVHLGDLWTFSSARDVPFLATLTPRDEALHYKVTRAFRDRNMEADEIQILYLSTQSVRATPSIVRLLFKHYGLVESTEDPYLHDFEPQVPSQEWSKAFQQPDSHSQS